MWERERERVCVCVCVCKQDEQSVCEQDEQSVCEMVKSIKMLIIKIGRNYHTPSVIHSLF